MRRRCTQNVVFTMKDALFATLLTLLKVVRAQKVDAMVTAHVTALDSLLDDTMRQTRLLEKLLPLPDEVAVMYMERMLEGARADRPRFRSVMNAFLNFQIALDAVDENRKRRWRKIAGAEGHHTVLALLSKAPPRKRYYADHQLDVNEQMEDRTLGHRKSLARSLDRHTLDRLLYDKHPGVVRILLNNPRIVERDVVKLAALQPTKAETLLEVFRHARWIRRYSVKKALAFNPYTPVSVVCGLLGHLREPDLIAIRDARHLSPEVREQAGALLRDKRSRRRRTLTKVPPPQPVKRVPSRPLHRVGYHEIDVGILALTDRRPPEPPETSSEHDDGEVDAVASEFLADLPEELPLVPVRNPRPQ